MRQLTVYVGTVSFKLIDLLNSAALWYNPEPQLILVILVTSNSIGPIILYTLALWLILAATHLAVLGGWRSVHHILLLNAILLLVR